MRRLAALLLLGSGALMLTSSAPGLPSVPGDPTPPVVTPVISGTLGTNGWYVTNTTVNWSITDPESIILSTSGCDTRTFAADTTGVTLTCSATSDGGTSTIEKPFKVDKTAPNTSASPSRTADVNGWYNRELTVDFAGNDGTSGLESCSAPQTYGGPDSGAATVSGTCRDHAGNTAPASLPFRYDETAPSTSPSARPPDSNGWHNHAVTVNFTGVDATSGVQNCTQSTYSGPDDPSVALSGTCVDQAGNQSSSSVFTLRYDETDPVATASAGRGPDVNGWYHAPVTFTFGASDATSGVESCDAPKTYSGPDAINTSVAGACRDRAGNAATPSASLKYDSTGPQVTTTPGRAPNGNGWYNAAVGVNFAGTDPTSGVASCDGTKTYSGPDSATASVVGTCGDNAGNTGSGSFALKFDATAPQATATPSRQPNGAGWYNAPLTVSFPGTDAMSGIESCTAQQSYNGPDTSTGSIAGSCHDKAGNTTARSLAFKYDATAPQLVATPSRQPNAAGWYNAPLAVGFPGTDATSGIESCTGDQSYSGPDTSTGSIAGSCHDRAGNTTARTLAFKYDATAPLLAATASRGADVNGWYNHALTVSFPGTDPTSGIASCTANQTYNGPDTSTGSIAGSCFDRAGNTTARDLSFKYDATAPSVSTSPARQPNAAGWYNAPLSVGFAGSDSTAGVASCEAARTYAGPDSATAAIVGTCLDNAGNVGAGSHALRYDASAPQVTPTPARAPNGNGWYNAAIGVSFAGTDPTSGVASCDTAKTYAGPDSAAAAVVGTCRDRADNTGAGSLAVRYDATAPQTAATPSRQPNANGWYNAQLSVSFAGTDLTSGIDTCDPAKTYSGPDSAGAGVGGNCRDKAGNAGTGSLSLRYDATAPQVTTSPGRPANANGWYNAAIAVGFSGGDATSGVDVCDAAKTYSGPDNGSASLSGNCRDKAGNTGTGSQPLKYDATAPQVTTSPGRAPNANGWYNAAIGVSFVGADPTSGVASCDPAKTYAGPDTATAVVSGICKDKADNTGAGSLALRYDATAPQATATASRQPNAGGWYNAQLSVSFAGTDVTSGLDACDAAKTYSGPDSAAASLSGNCRDKAGNAGTASQAIKYDATAPQVTASTARGPDVNGWYNAPIAVGFSGGDATSGIDACDPAKTYAGPDSGTAGVSGNCRDKAGNSGSATRPFKYDATGPQAAASASRQPNARGWYNAPLTVSFAATDSVSGLAACPTPKSYDGPDAAAVSVTGVCLDNAGNGGLATLPLKYDATAPQASASTSRAPNGNGWFKAPLAVAFNGSDDTSGIDACDPAKQYSGPDTTSASLSGSCRDRAGNSSASAGVMIRYDATAPIVTHGVPVRPADHDGWYNRPVAFALQGTDATSGIDGSCSTASYAGPDSASASYAGACDDKAGNRGFKAFPLRYDATGPDTVAFPSRGADVNGWYNQPLTVSYAGSDPVSGLDSCSPPENYGGPDSASAIVGGICLDQAGNASLAALDLHYDGTAPQVTSATPSRVPDANGWYSSPLTVRFHGSDATSQIEACDEAQYAGPDAGEATVTGSCRDRAGNGSPARSFSLKYDSTRPSLTGVTVKAGNGTAVLSWTASEDTVVVEIRRGSKVVYQGTGRSFTDTGLQNGVRYRYWLTAYDEAHNAATAEASASPTAPLLSPKAGAVVSSPPRLAWRAVPNTKYYNVQVLRRGRIFSAWPRSTSLQLKRTWTYKGRRYKLTPGRYRWYVWPGRGRPSERRFGRLIGSSSFVVR
jgi:hypothetical protein